MMDFKKNPRTDFKDVAKLTQEQARPEIDALRVAGRPAARLEKVRHTAPMLSLNAVYREKEVEDFVRMVRREAGSQRIEYAAEPKFDGLSVERDASSTKPRGRMSRRSTRRHFRN